MQVTIKGIPGKLHGKAADIVLRVVCPLGIGLGVYAFFRPDSKFHIDMSTPLPRCFSWLGNAPDPLWAYAFCQALFLSGDGGHAMKCAVVLVTGFGFELLQGSVLPGAPSPADMICYLAACLAAILTPAPRRK